MQPNAPNPIADGDLHALLDGRLSEAEARDLRDRLKSDPISQNTLMQMEQQKKSLRAFHAQVLSEPLPPALERAANRLVQLERQRASWLRLGGMAASIAVAFVGGWLAHMQLNSHLADTSIAGLSNRHVREFIQQATVAHAVYAPELRHPVEVAAAQQEHLVQWLSKRLGTPLKVPNLAAQGYELVGGRLLPGENSARAQFMFQNTAGVRLTLYVGAVAPTDLASQETAFRYSDQGPVPGFYWVDKGFGYALSGAVSRENLLDLAQLTYQQLIER